MKEAEEFASATSRHHTFCSINSSRSRNQKEGCL